jgi:hypothetical protein
LFINLSREDEVDYVLKMLPKLQLLNGLGVDREEIVNDQNETAENLNNMSLPQINSSDQ